MTPNEYIKLLEVIQKSHTSLSITKNKMRKIKYITCNYDTRDNSIYRVSLREWFVKESISFPIDVEFGKALRIKELYEDIIKWLQEVYE